MHFVLKIGIEKRSSHLFWGLIILLITNRLLDFLIVLWLRREPVLARP